MLCVQLDYTLLKKLEILELNPKLIAYEWMLHLFPSRSQTFKEPDDEPDTILSSVDENVILVIGDVWPVRLYFNLKKLN